MVKGHQYYETSVAPNIRVVCGRCGRTKIEHDEDFLPASSDNVNHPAHYNAYKHLEIIDLTEQMNFNRGNAVKYICRAGIKDKDKEVEDLEKAVWYLKREIERIKA